MVEVFYTARPQTETGHARREDGYQHTHSSGWSHVIFFPPSTIPLQLKLHLTTIQLRLAQVFRIFSTRPTFLHIPLSYRALILRC